MNETLDIVPCLVPGLDHSWVFTIAAFGVSVYKCEFCGDYTDEVEDNIHG